MRRWRWPSDGPPTAVWSRASSPSVATLRAPDQRDAVAHAELHAHHSRIVANEVVDRTDGDGVVAAVTVVDDLPAPQRVVDGDDPGGRQLREHRLVVVGVVRLVGVDEHEVERPVEGGDGVEGGTKAVLDPV